MTFDTTTDYLTGRLNRRPDSTAPGVMTQEGICDLNK
jgi:hypothetical protein